MMRVPWKLIGAACVVGGILTMSADMARGGGIIFAGAIFILIGCTGRGRG